MAPRSRNTDSFENLRRFREQSMEMAQEFFWRAQGELQQTVSDIQSRIDELRGYIRSESFERDLDQLADRLGMQDGRYPVGPAEDRERRVRAKAQYLFEGARREVFRAAERGGAFAVISRRSRVVVAIAAVCGGIKGAEIAYQCYQVFMPGKRRVGLRVVE